MKILVVDDSDIIRLLVIELLKENIAGLEVSEAKNGKEAYDIIYGERFDLVITDHFMPIMNGANMIIEVLRGCPLNVGRWILMTSTADELDDYPVVKKGVPLIDKSVLNEDLISLVRGK